MKLRYAVNKALVDKCGEVCTAALINIILFLVLCQHESKSVYEIDIGSLPNKTLCILSKCLGISYSQTCCIIFWFFILCLIFLTSKINCWKLFIDEFRHIFQFLWGGGWIGTVTPVKWWNGVLFFKQLQIVFFTNEIRLRCSCLPLLAVLLSPLTSSAIVSPYQQCYCLHCTLELLSLVRCCRCWYSCISCTSYRVMPQRYPYTAVVFIHNPMRYSHLIYSVELSTLETQSDLMNWGLVKEMSL